jgi:hypothetical protein
MKIKLLIIMFALSLPLGAQKLIITGNTIGSYIHPDTICFYQATGNYVKVCAPIVVVEDSEFIELETYTACLPTTPLCTDVNITANALQGITDCLPNDRLNINGIGGNWIDIISVDWYGSTGGSLTLVLDDATPEECAVPPYTTWQAHATILHQDSSLCIAESNVFSSNASDCEFDNSPPGIAGLNDECITDLEWNQSYSTFVDSAAFFLQSNFTYYEQYSLLTAIDNCAIDTFYLAELKIVPPGGINRVSGFKAFNMIFNAIDFSGNIGVDSILWVREENDCGLLRSQLMEQEKDLGKE